MNEKLLTRFEAISQIVEHNGNNKVYFTTTGKASREFLQQEFNIPLVFPCVGGMGYVSSIAYSYAFNSDRETICIDGDGSFFMHLGALPSFNTDKRVSFTHYLLDNGSHQSVGGGTTVGKHVDFIKLSQSLGYDFSIEVQDAIGLKNASKFVKPRTKSFIRVKINSVENLNVPRPSVKLTHYVKKFMDVNSE
jgi:phosphonopyruvate decarboxylase